MRNEMLYLQGNGVTLAYIPSIYIHILPVFFPSFIYASNIPSVFIWQHYYLMPFRSDIYHSANVPRCNSFELNSIYTYRGSEGSVEDMRITRTIYEIFPLWFRYLERKYVLREYKELNLSVVIFFCVCADQERAL